MTRKFKKPDYVATPNTPISLGEAIPANHLARFVVDIVAQLDLSPIYAHYSAVGGEAIAPEGLLALIFYGYATGKFSSRKIERGTYEDLGFRFVAGGLHPDHDTIANFRKTFLPELHGLFIQILLMAQLSGMLKVGNLSLDGSKIHADASKDCDSYCTSFVRSDLFFGFHLLTAIRQFLSQAFGWEIRAGGIKQINSSIIGQIAG